MNAFDKEHAEVKKLLDEIGLEGLLSDPSTKERFMSNIRKYGLSESDLPMIDKFLKVPATLSDREKMEVMTKFGPIMEAFQNAAKKPKKMYYEDLIRAAYDPRYWDKVKNYTPYTWDLKELESFFLDNEPDPNIILLSGISENLGEIGSDTVVENYLDLPFTTCVIEATDHSLFNLPMNVASDAMAMIVVEMGPAKYGFLVLTESGHTLWALDQKKDNWKMCMKVAQSLCSFINSKKVAVGQSSTRIKLKSKKHGNHFIKKLVHISAKIKDVPAEKRYTNVDWSHQWEVRGHRRKLADGKLGKDRNGNYTWVGYTWVRPHVKGPDDKDLIKKVRVKKYEQDQNLYS